MPSTDDETPNGIWFDGRFIPFICGGAPDDGNQTGDEPIDTPSAVAPPPPSFVPADEFKTFQTSIMDRLDEMRQGMAAMRTAPQAPMAIAPAADRISEEQFENAVTVGDGKVVRAYIRQEKDDLKREHIDPLSAVGLDGLANLTKQVTFKEMPRYEKYKKEIDASLATLPAATRLNPEVLKVMYDAVVGRHADEIEADARQSAARTRDAEPAEGAPTRRAARVPTGDQIRTVEDLAGDEGIKALGELGRGGKDANEFARALGYDSWKDYMKKTEAYV